MAEERVLNIPGAHNFRDMGGYKTSDGRKVRWGQLYRSGLMSKVEPRDYNALHDLGIVTICDLRTTKERRNRPTTWHEEKPVEVVSRDYDMSAGAIRNLIRERRADSAAVEAHINAIYSELLAEQAPSYSELFRRLADGKVPLVFNCSAGKDRTGIAAALILDLLGVAREEILADYELSNEAIEGLVQIISEDEDYRDWYVEQPDAAYPMLRAEPHYLENMFRELDERYGGVRAYLVNVLKLNDADIANVRANLVE